jgi:polysaccharide biosynthesis/export protein
VKSRLIRCCAAAVLVAGAVIPVFGQESRGDYRIGSKDLLEIHVLEIPELNVERRVAEDGSIDLPLLGQVPVSGLTPSEAQKRIESFLTAKYVNRANVSVIVKEYASKPISILGAVGHPGPLTIAGNWYLLQAIVAAGGLTPEAGKKIYVLRHAKNGLSSVLVVNVDDLFRADSAKWNVPLFPTDIVNIPPKTMVRIFCFGEVKNPGTLEFDSDQKISLVAAIARAGGLTDRASNAIHIKRKGAGNKFVDTVVNFKRIVEGKDADPTLQPDDVILVKESFF